MIFVPIFCARVHWHRAKKANERYCRASLCASSAPPRLCGEDLDL